MKGKVIEACELMSGFSEASSKGDMALLGLG